MQPKCPCGSRAAARARSRTALVGVSFLIAGRDVPTGCVFSDRSVGRTTLVGVSFLIAGRDVPTGCVFSDRPVGRITLVGVRCLIAGRDVPVVLRTEKKWSTLKAMPGLLVLFWAERTAVTFLWFITPLLAILGIGKMILLHSIGVMVEMMFKQACWVIFTSTLGFLRWCRLIQMGVRCR